MKPAARDGLLAALAELHLKTVRQASDDEDFRARMNIYARELSAYPGDVALAAVRGWYGKFFPSWAELAEEIALDRRLKERRLRIAALQEYLAGPEPGPERKPWRPSPEEFAAHKVKLDAKLNAKYAPCGNVPHETPAQERAGG